MIGNRIEGTTKLKWNSTTQVNRSAEIKPFPGIKRTLEDFVRKPFRATPVPSSTHNPRLVVMTEDRQEVKKACVNHQLKNRKQNYSRQWQPQSFNTCASQKVHTISTGVAKQDPPTSE